MRFVMVPSAKGRECLDTRRVEDVFARNKAEVSVYPAGSAEGTNLAATAAGHFGRRKKEGHPLVVLFNDKNEVVWATCEPSTKQLMAQIAKIEVVEQGESVAV